MMTKNLIKGILFAGVFSMAISVNAQDAVKKVKPAPTPEKLLKNFDTDKNGSINKAEAEANKNQSIFKKFDKVDADKNGEISKSELQTMIDKRNNQKKGGKKAKKVQE
ncbi:EF-hand domain-containing protein [Lutibacter citreus]|uniref:EF-hand domain-containing protein n=1 Tax=Lutibacter citreus TaxID=2138210 RepID=UPI000DBE1D53|nr:EF-hand domain-containing protein [Lutibacter citreus]